MQQNIFSRGAVVALCDVTVCIPSQTSSLKPTTVHDKEEALTKDRSFVVEKEKRNNIK